ncbi:MAG TPA: guanylate cyclase, partial [Ruminiclostridium sp.]|nr:guanylate cyclase [Ruminiclostridium sp.]
VENFGILAESRKNVAVMFADISGFTALSEQLDPEEVREIINECFNYITSPVYELEGMIDKYIGDCIMILFGARYTHIDDAKRAVTCALKMMDLISEFSKNFLFARGITLNLSIGINYGLVVTGGVGNYFDRDYTVMGDIVNTAQRLQMSAGEGVILASESVFTETRDQFEYADPIEVKVKNKVNPIRCYQPLKINSNYFYDQELAFIERQKEIGVLNSIFNEALNTGLKCAIVTGEAGIGKTRLLKEFTLKLGNDIKKAWVNCNTISQNKSYSLIANLLAGIMSINALDSANTKKHRLISFLDYILVDYNDDEIKHTYDFLGLLMGLERDPDFQSIFASMNYESIYHELLKQLALFFKSLCKKQKLLVIADDAHWADSGSIQILNGLVPMLKDIKAVFIFSSRYDLKQLIPGSPDLKFRLKLRPLTRAGVKQLSCSLLNSQKIEDHFYDTILKITKGNPLFIKEMLSNLKRKGAYSVQSGQAVIRENELAAMPEKLQNLIRSNISALDEKSLTILQAAAVIGKEFSLSILNYLLDESVTNEELAGIPVQLNLISLKSTHTSAGRVDKIYEFTHEIEREVIYGSILNKEKISLHKKISEYLENTYAKDIENYYESLCVHLIKAGMPKKAAGYYFKAAMKQKDGFNLSSALECLNRFIKMMGSLPKTASDDRIFIAYREKGRIHYINANYNDALEQFYKALDYASMQDDRMNIKIQIAEVYKDMGELDKASAILNDLELDLHEGSLNYGKWVQLKCNVLRIKGDTAVLSLAKKSEKPILKTGDYRSLAETMKHAGMIYFSKGDIDNSLFYMNKSYKYAEKNKLLEIMAKVSGDIGIIYHSTGMISRAMDFFNKSMEISKKLSYQRGVLAASINLGILYLDKGLFSKAEKLFLESLAVAREIGSKLYECAILTNLGDISYETGDIELSKKNYLDSLSLAMDLNAPVEEGINYLGLARIHLKSVRFQEASRLLEKAFTIFEEADELVFIGDCCTYRGYVEQQTGRPEKAEGYYNKALEIFSECRNDNKKLKALRYKIRLLAQKGSLQEALELIEGAISDAGRLESDYESAKCWFEKYMVLKAMELRAPAYESLDQSALYISKVDDCTWSEIISQHNTHPHDQPFRDG